MLKVFKTLLSIQAELCYYFKVIKFIHFYQTSIFLYFWNFILNRVDKQASLEIKNTRLGKTRLNYFQKLFQVNINLECACALCIVILA